MSLNIHAQAGGSAQRTIDITIHRCNNIPVKRRLGLTEKRKYFAKVTIGDQSRDTSVRVGENGSVEWAETFTFYDVQRTSMALDLYRAHTFGSPKQVIRLVVSLPQVHDGMQHPITRAMTFVDGPAFEYSVAVHGTVEQPMPHVAEESAGIRSDSKQPESGVPAVEDIDQAPEEVPRNEPEVPAVEDIVSQEEHQEVVDTQDAEEAIKQAQQALESRRTLGERWQQALTAMSRLSDITKPFAEMNSYAQAAHAIFFGMTVPLAEQAELDEAVKDLLDSITNFYNIVKDVSGSALGESMELRDVLKRASEQILDIAYFVCDSCGQGFATRALKNIFTADSGKVQEYRGKVDNLKAEFSTRLSLLTSTGVVEVRTVVDRTETMVIRVLNQVTGVVDSTILEDIGYVREAGWNKDKICLEGTRTGMRSELVGWADSPGSRVLLLFGGAGTGKSSIAHTIAEYFKGLGRLGSMFCFSESEKATRKTTSLFPNIARDLADLDENIRAELCTAARNKADRTTSSLIAQFETLILSPANAVRNHLHGPIVIVIDALDESGTVEERRVLLKVLASRLKELPPNFRVIITSRPDPDIRRAFVEPDLLIREMDSIPPESTVSDITIYVNHELADDQEADGYIRQGLVFHARGLFQWAKVACDFIRNPGPGETALSRFEVLTLPLKSGYKAELRGDNLLDDLYMAVLSRIFPLRTAAQLEKFKSVMQRVLMAFEPLSCRSLNQLLAASNTAPKGCKADNVIKYLGSLLSGTNNQDTPIQPLHTSFRDFLTDNGRSKEFFVNSNDSNIHADMAWASMVIMRNELKFNICRLESSHLANKEVTDIEERVKTYISRHLSYVCHFWAAHLCTVLEAESGSESGPVDRITSWTKLMGQVEDWTKMRLLYWLEVLSVEGTLDTTLQKVGRLAMLMKKAKMKDELLMPPIEQAEEFCSYFAKCIGRSAPHIYISALPFAPRNSFVAKEYLSARGKALSLAAGQLRAYPSCLNILEGHILSVALVAFSPDGLRIVSGSDDKTIRVWNAQTGDMVLGPLQGHTDWVTSVAFSPDGSRIVSGSGDKTIRIWNAQTGDMVLGPLQGHTDWVTSVAFSPDGSHIVSGSGDETIRIWNAQTGDMVLGPLQGHTSWVTSVAFSPDGLRIVSGSDDKTIRVWNAQTGDMVLGPLQGHTSSVRSVAFSPDGSRIVSGSGDETIRIWNAQTGDMVLGPLQGHTDWVTSVAFSPDGSRIVSGSGNNTILMWNAENGDVLLSPHEAHPQSAQFNATSPDGSRLATGSDTGNILIQVTTPSIQTQPSTLIYPHMLTMQGDTNYIMQWYQWRMDDGWSLGPTGELLFYVPPVHRPGLCPPTTLFVTPGVGHYTLLDFSQFAHGSRWMEAFDPDATVSSQRIPAP